MKMDPPKMKVIRFESSDVIATSAQPLDYFSFSGLYDGPNGETQKMIYNGTDYTGKGSELWNILTQKYHQLSEVYLIYEGIHTSELPMTNYIAFFNDTSKDISNIANLRYLNDTLYYYRTVDHGTGSVVVEFKTN